VITVIYRGLKEFIGSSANSHCYFEIKKEPLSLSDKSNKKKGIVYY